MMPTTTGLAQSIHVRLVRHAHELGLDPNQILSRYVAERFLYRLSRSRHILAWLGEDTRPTQDADLLGYGDLFEAALAAVIREVLSVEVEPDGLPFGGEAVSATWQPGGPWQ